MMKDSTQYLQHRMVTGLERRNIFMQNQNPNKQTRAPPLLCSQVLLTVELDNGRHVDLDVEIKRQHPLHDAPAAFPLRCHSSYSLSQPLSKHTLRWIPAVWAPAVISHDVVHLRFKRLRAVVAVPRARVVTRQWRHTSRTRRVDERSNSTMRCQ